MMGQSAWQRESRNAIRVTRPRIDESDVLPASTSWSVNGGAGRFPAGHVACPCNSGRGNAAGRED